MPRPSSSPSDHDADSARTKDRILKQAGDRRETLLIYGGDTIVANAAAGRPSPPHLLTSLADITRCGNCIATTVYSCDSCPQIRPRPVHQTLDTRTVRHCQRLRAWPEHWATSHPTALNVRSSPQVVFPQTTWGRCLFRARSLRFTSSLSSGASRRTEHKR